MCLLSQMNQNPVVDVNIPMVEKMCEKTGLIWGSILCGVWVETIILPINILIYPPQVKYKGEIKQATAISDPPELKRVKENQRNISNVWS